jgi:phage terminase large subunit GpA-like protein
MVYHYLSRKRVGQSINYPRGYIHFARDLHEDFYKQLVAEEMYQEVSRSGLKTIRIENRKQRRNEALDVVKMNYLAMYYLFLGYFDGLNSARRRNKRAEVEKNIDAFMDMMEGLSG